MEGPLKREKKREVDKKEGKGKREEKYFVSTMGFDRNRREKKKNEKKTKGKERKARDKKREEERRRKKRKRR